MTLRPSHNDWRMDYDGGNPIVFLDFALGSLPATPLGRVKIELFADSVPKTAQNFYHLCIGSHRDPSTNKPLGYLRSNIHSVQKGVSISGGDWVRLDGTGNQAVFIDQPLFGDEPSQPHNTPGLVSMIKTASNNLGYANGSQFMISTVPMPQLDGIQVVVGRVVEGLDVVKMIAETRTKNGRPEKAVTVTGCGQM